MKGLKIMKLKYFLHSSSTFKFKNSVMFSKTKRLKYIQTLSKLSKQCWNKEFTSNTTKGAVAWEVKKVKRGLAWVPYSSPCLTNVWLTSSKISQPSMIILSMDRFFLMFSVSLTSSCIIYKTILTGYKISVK